LVYLTQLQPTTTFRSQSYQNTISYNHDETVHVTCSCAQTYLKTVHDFVFICY